MISKSVWGGGGPAKLWENKGDPNLQTVVNALVQGKKLLAENLQYQQKHPAEHTRNQQSAFEKQQQNITQLMSFS